MAEENNHNTIGNPVKKDTSGLYWMAFGNLATGLAGIFVKYQTIEGYKYAPLMAAALVFSFALSYDLFWKVVK